MDSEFEGYIKAKLEEIFEIVKELKQFKNDIMDITIEQGQHLIKLNGNIHSIKQENKIHWFLISIILGTIIGIGLKVILK